MQIMFKRVGADTGVGSGKRLSPIFPGRFFHFITLPRHVDPELFYKFTYGDLLQSKRKPHNPNPTASPLKKLRKDDVLIFYAGFQNRREKLIGIFAYIVVENAYILDHQERLALEFSRAEPGELFENTKKNRKDYCSCRKEFGRWNPHVNVDTWPEAKRVENILVCGNVSRSRMLSKVEILAKIADGRYKLNRTIANRWGFTPELDFTRNMPHHVKEEKTKRVWHQLQRLK